MLDILLNDTPTQIAENMPLAEALTAWGYDINNASYAVAINMTFVLNSEYAQTMLQSGDKVEIVTPMQGG